LVFWVRVCCCVLVCFERVDWAAVGARIWALSSNGRAPASHAGGRGIDTPSVHFLPTRNTFYDRQIFHALPSPRLPLTLSKPTHGLSSHLQHWQHLVGAPRLLFVNSVRLAKGRLNQPTERSSERLILLPRMMTVRGPHIAGHPVHTGIGASNQTRQAR
jgi:hypothetical protein